MQPFNHLKIWQRSHALSIAIRKLTQRRSFRGYADIKGQINRSSSSVPWNIAEGCGAESKADFAKFLDTSIKSLNEAESQLQTCGDLALIPMDVCTQLT
ncbi:MAG: four helix bundle protein, partial [Acidobacteria bacterium]|nr:four helix bundle protein [Acidobacteriota bacterium]